MHKLLWLCCLALCALNLYSFSLVHDARAAGEDSAKEISRWRQLASGSDQHSFEQLFEGFDEIKGPRGLHVLALRATCGACEAAAPSWNAMAAERTAAGYGFVGLATTDDNLDEFIARHGLQFPVLVATAEMLKELPLLYTPSATIFDPEGRIEAMGIAAEVVQSKGSNFYELTQSWPPSLADQFFTAIGETLLGQPVTRMEVEVDGIRSPTHVFETASGIAGFGVHLNCEQVSPRYSDVEAFIVTDDAGRVMGVVPLRRGHRPGGELEREEIEGWARDRQLLASAEESSQERDFKRELRAARISLGFSALAPE